MVAIQSYLAEQEFMKMKARTLSNFENTDWNPDELRGLKDTLEQFTYWTQSEPRIAFVSIYESLMAKSLRELGQDPNMLSLAWLEKSCDVDGIRIQLKNGKHVDHQLKSKAKSYDFSAKYFVYLRKLVVASDIESVSLVSDGEQVSDPITPNFRHRHTNPIAE